MPGKHPPGYHGRRNRIRTFILNEYRRTRPDEYQQAWADGEAQENQKDAGLSCHQCLDCGLREFIGYEEEKGE